MSVSPDGVVEIVPVTVAMLVKFPVEGEVAPIVVLLIVLLVIVAPLMLGSEGGRKAFPLAQQSIGGQTMVQGQKRPEQGQCWLSE
jgi:hypothetical protein